MITIYGPIQSRETVPLQGHHARGFIYLLYVDVCRVSVCCVLAAVGREVVVMVY
jgi:hypothetical protein